MAKKRYKTKGSLRSKDFAVPANTKEAADFLKEIGENRRAITRLETQMNDKIAEIKQTYEFATEPYAEAIDALICGLQSYAEANRELLTEGGKTKTIEMQTGTVSWRNRPPKVTLRNKEKILQSLKALGLQRLIRTEEDIDKAAILKESDAASGISGITVSSDGEDFFATPYELEIDNQN